MSRTDQRLHTTLGESHAYQTKIDETLQCKDVFRAHGEWDRRCQPDQVCSICLQVMCCVEYHSILCSLTLGGTRKARMHSHIWVGLLDADCKKRQIEQAMDIFSRQLWTSQSSGRATDT